MQPNALVLLGGEGRGRERHRRAGGDHAGKCTRSLESTHQAGGGALALLVLAIGGVLGIAWITGNVNVPRLRGRIAGATSLVNSAASAVTSAVSSVVGSSLPNGVPLPPVPSAPALTPPSSAAAESA